MLVATAVPTSTSEPTARPGLDPRGMGGSSDVGRQQPLRIARAPLDSRRGPPHRLHVAADGAQARPLAHG